MKLETYTVTATMNEHFFVVGVVVLFMLIAMINTANNNDTVTVLIVSLFLLSSFNLKE